MFHTNILTGNVEMRFVENSNIPRLQTHSGLVMYANYLEHLVERAQEMQIKYQDLNQAYYKQLGRAMRAEAALRTFKQEHNIDELLRDRHRLIKARMRIQKAKRAYFDTFLLGIDYAKKFHNIRDMTFLDITHAESLIKERTENHGNT